jgi:hypothetical protein
MFAYGAALSFDVLHSIAQAAGLSPVLAWLWPLGFETFMAVTAVAVLAEQRTRPHKTPWYPWALAAGSSIALNFGHPYIPLDPPPRLLVALVYGVPPICAPFAWHLYLLRLAHRRHQDGSQYTQHAGQDAAVLADRQDQPEQAAEAAAAAPAGNGQDGQDREPARALVRVVLVGESQDRPVSWQDVADRTGLSRSRAYALLREERAQLAAGNGRRPTSTPPTRRRDWAPVPGRSTPMRVRLRILVPGTQVSVRRPGRGERGTWVVGDRLVGPGTDDPAYELRQERSGRTRILRRSRLRLARTSTRRR